MATPPQLNALVEDYRTLQEKLRENQLCKQQLLVQVNENETVLQELKTLESDAILYKLVGPILVPQSKDDAQSVVEKRLEYIATEITRVHKLSEELSSKLETCTKQLEEFQHQFSTPPLPPTII